jgi:hypothetical protein
MREQREPLNQWAEFYASMWGKPDTPGYDGVREIILTVLLDDERVYERKLNERRCCCCCNGRRGCW